jgi:diguanylate cyclase
MLATLELSPGFFSGIAFAALLLCAGLAIGLWVASSWEAKRKDRERSEQAMRVVSQLSGWTANFASDMASYRETIDLFARRLAEIEERPDPAVASSLMGRVNEANDCLQRRIEAAEEALRRQATDISTYLQEARTDALTGLPNRRSFDDEFQRRVAQWRRKRVPFSLMLLDVDRFKQLNDTHGHPAGDAVLSEVGRLLREHTEEGELAARFGGEEFVVLLPCDDEASLADACERFSQAISACDVPFEGRMLKVTVSSGAAVAGEAELGPHLIKRADEALYAAKRGGRNCGYWHNGTAIVPLTGRGVEAAIASASCASPSDNSESPPMPASRAREAASSSEFREVCSDLRRRLEQLTSEHRRAL